MLRRLSSRKPSADSDPNGKDLEANDMAGNSSYGAAYLEAFGYAANWPAEWRTSPREDLLVGGPRLALAIAGHSEVGGHTVYAVRCRIVATRLQLCVEWRAPRRLSQLRDGLHDAVKNCLGVEYAQRFAEAPFARSGGLPGTTAKLCRWFDCLAECVNDGVAQPSVVAQILTFLEAPAVQAKGQIKAALQAQLQERAVAMAQAEALAQAQVEAKAQAAALAEAKATEEAAVKKAAEEAAAKKAAEEVALKEKAEAAVARKSAEEAAAKKAAVEAAPERYVEQAATKQAAQIGEATRADEDAAPPAEEAATGEMSPNPFDEDLGAGTPFEPALAEPTDEQMGCCAPSVDLEQYGYAPASSSEWRCTPVDDVCGPELTISVCGHSEQDGHTFYNLRCRLATDCLQLCLEWQAPRRLAHIREGLYASSKATLGDDYGNHFAEAATFPKHGLPGTSKKLGKWLDRLATCVNTGVVPPAFVEKVLTFLDIPPLSSTDEDGFEEAEEEHVEPRQGAGGVGTKMRRMKKAFASVKRSSASSSSSSEARRLTPEAMSELQQLHAARSTSFDPDEIEEHAKLLRSLWGALLPGSAFKREGSEWKSIGFQGEDPVKDVRAGGLLAVQCLEHFATVYTEGIHRMLTDLRAVADGESFYPVSAMAIVISTWLCDAMGISKGQLGVVAEQELNMMITSKKCTRYPLLKFLGLVPPERGFDEMFAYLFVDFHIRFVRQKASYMKSQQLLGEAGKELRKRASNSSDLKGLRDRYCEDGIVNAMLVRSGASYA